MFSLCSFPTLWSDYLTYCDSSNNNKHQISYLSCMRHICRLSRTAYLPPCYPKRQMCRIYSHHICCIKKCIICFLLILWDIMNCFKHYFKMPFLSSWPDASGHWQIYCNMKPGSIEMHRNFQRYKLLLLPRPLLVLLSININIINIINSDRHVFTLGRVGLELMTW